MQRLELEKKRLQDNSGHRTYVVSDVFKEGDSCKTRAITKSKCKHITVDLLLGNNTDSDHGIGRYPKLSQTYRTELATYAARRRVIELLNAIIYDQPIADIDDPMFNPDMLYAHDKVMDSLIAVLTLCAKEMCITQNSSNASATSSMDDYDGTTIHNLITDYNLSTLLPIGTRGPIGVIAQEKICASKGITEEVFLEQHIKVNVKNSPLAFLKYRDDEIDIVKGAIMEVAHKEWLLKKK